MSDDPNLHAARLKRARAVIAEVAAELGVPVAAILGDSRQVDVAAARHETMVRLWRQDMAIATIARTLGMNHTSVIWGIRRRIGAETYKAESNGPGRRGRRAEPRVRVA